MNTETLQSCDILLFQGQRFISKLIRFGTKSKYSHVGVVINPNTFLGIDAVGKGVRAFDLRKEDEKFIDVYRIKEEHSFDKDAVVSFLVNRLGSKYDLLGVTWLGVLKTFSLITGKKSKPYNRFQKGRDYFCSELAYEAFFGGGLDIVPEVPSADVTSPADISRSSITKAVWKNIK
jgi:uncharacterized protein YycO